MNKHLFLTVLVLSLIFINSNINGQQFTEMSISLTSVSAGSLAWGDYDNDGDLDILLTGYSNSGPVSKIYRNNGDNTFTDQTSISLTGVYGSSVAWGDYDNDGDLDILLTGFSNSGIVSKIYRNNGDNTFTEQTSISLTGVFDSSVAWGDLDNDGDLDILLTGQMLGNNYVSKIYQNNGDNTFTEQTSISLSGVAGSSVALGDYDNDGDLDILLTGSDNSVRASKIYRNNGDNTFTEQTSISLTSVDFGSVAWGDYDDDGDLDILLTGATGIFSISKIYRNNGDNTFTEQTSISLTGVGSSSVALGDYDNDGDLDILLTGATGIGAISKIYQNNGDNTFTEQTSISLTGVGASSVAWGDYDNDGDLDIILTGGSSGGIVSKIYRNNNSIANTLPTSPTNLTSIVNNGQDVTFSWDKSTDNETPQNGLRYNLVIGTSPGAVDILSPMSDRATGYRRIISLGNTNHKNSWTIKGLELGIYYWSVQAIDNTFAGSNFITEKSFAISDLFTEITSISLAGVFESSVAWGDYDIDGDLDILLTGLDSTNNPVSKVYRNNLDNTFTEQTSISLTGVEGGSVAWGDYDNDGDLDILLTGYSNSGPVSKIYRNNGYNIFAEQTSISLTEVSGSSVAWADYDNDGDLDILLTGYTNSGPVSKIYQNNGDNAFIEQMSISLTGVDFSSVAWGDYDNDGDLDLLLTGESSSGKVSIIYRNNGNNTFTQNSFLTGVYLGSVAWGDYDNDGYLDILLTGSSLTGLISKIYRNNGNNTFTEQTSISLTEVANSSVAWGDCDNDGDLDILLTGELSSGRISKVYNNNGDNTFTEQTLISLTGVAAGSVAWADYDNDGDLDILLTGLDTYDNRVSKIYRNNISPANTPPTSPTNLISTINGVDVTFSWDKSTDNETPQNGLKYNLVIGTSPGAVNKLSPMSDRATGYRRIISLGNTNHMNSWTIKNLSSEYLYWSVQALDNNFEGSNWAQEKITLVEDKIISNLPTSYSLDQNFPNPFNPSTTIDYSVPEVSFITLKVFDVLGNEVATLVNENKPVGDYEVEFNRIELPSGMYFYQLRAGSFTETKKMVLIK